MYTVLVADDEEELRRALIQKVDWNAAGFKVIGEAENGAEALEMVEAKEPDLLLTDIRMPFVSGIDLARQVREIRPATQIALLSGYDDFSYAQQAIQYNIISYLLKPISAAEMLIELQKMKQKIDEKFSEFKSPSLVMEQGEISEFIMPLVLDGFQGESDETREQMLEKQAIKYGLIKESHGDFRYAVMITSLSDEQGNNQTTRATVNAIDMILRKYIRHTSFFAQGKVVSLLIASQTGFDRYLHIIVEDIAQSVKRILNLKSYIGLSRSMERISSVHEAYVEAMNAIGYSKRNSSGVQFITDIERTDSIDWEMIQNVIGEVEVLVRSGKREEIEDYLNHLFDHMQEANMSGIAIGFFLTQMISVIFRIVYAVADSEAIGQLQNMISYQNQIYMDTKENRQKFINFFLMAREIVADQRKKSSAVICDRAVELIDQQYSDPTVSLVSISNEIAVSPNYLSAVIKKSTGRTFVDLLTEKRIEKARELLLCSSMKIKEIAESCGYNDQHYFSYSFKKYTGMSPIACRRSLNEKNE